MLVLHRIVGLFSASISKNEQEKKRTQRERERKEEIVLIGLDVVVDQMSIRTDERKNVREEEEEEKKNYRLNSFSE